jgi:hypothetical protein
MELSSLNSADRAKLEQALREGQPVTLNLDRLPRDRPADELLPLVDTLICPNSSLRRSMQPLMAPRAQRGRSYRVTAVIPTNRGTPLGLAALRSQDCNVEVLVLANGKATPEGDRVLRVPWEGHGPTRQRGVQAAKGEFILFSVDDALPRGRGVVSTLVEALVEGGFDAVFGRQVPWPSADPITRERLRRWTPPGASVQAKDRLDHVFALVRRETLLRDPLPPVPIAEDLHWRRNHRIGYVPQAPVVHSHTREPGTLYRRTRDIHRQHRALGDPALVPSLGALVRALPGIINPVLRAGPRELPNQLAELLGQWRGGRSR